MKRTKRRRRSAKRRKWEATREKGAKRGGLLQMHAVDEVVRLTSLRAFLSSQSWSRAERDARSSKVGFEWDEEEEDAWLG